MDQNCDGKRRGQLAALRARCLHPRRWHAQHGCEAAWSENDRAGLGCVKTKDETTLRNDISHIGKIVDESTQFGVPGATSEKFVLAIVRLDAFLHGQGHSLPSRSPLAEVCYPATS